MSGHTHMNSPGLTQNQGNILGDRPCVRQSRLYREGCGGNVMKEILGQDSLKWDTTRTQGAYRGGRVYDHNAEDNRAVKTDNASHQSKTLQLPPQCAAAAPVEQQRQHQNYDETVSGGMRVYTPNKSAQPKNQQRGPAVRYECYENDEENVQVVAMDAEEDEEPQYALPQQQQRSEGQSRQSPPAQQQQQQQQQQDEEPSYSSLQTSNSAYGATRRAPNQNQRSQPTEPEGRSVTGKGFRPGCGQANRQTYNIFTGQ